MKRDTEMNQFLSIVYDLYDHIRFPNQYKKETVTVKDDKAKGISKLFATKQVEVDPDLDIIYRRIALTKENLLTNPPSFSELWDFCEFVRASEKIFFYTNDPKNALYVEMDWNNRSSLRKFIIKDEDDKYEIRFSLERDIFGIDVISIHVLRNFGLKMENSYKITDRNMDFEDSSDIYLINEINRLLSIHMINIFSSIVELIDEGDKKNE